MPREVTVGISRSVTSRSSGILEASRGRRTLSSFHERASTRHVGSSGPSRDEDFPGQRARPSRPVRDGLRAYSSVWLERTPDKREVGSSTLPRPTNLQAGKGGGAAPRAGGSGRATWGYSSVGRAPA